MTMYISFLDSNDFIGDTHILPLTTGLSIPGGRCVNIPTIQDFALEGDHDFSVTISAISPSGVITIGTPSTHSITINDDGGKLFSASKSPIFITYLRHL